MDKVVEFWNNRPCNIKHSDKAIGSLEYFEEGKKLDPQNKKMQKYINLVTKKLY